MQEVCVDIALPDNHIIPDIHFKREVLQWQGLLYPQDLVQAQYEYFNLTQGVFPSFVPTHLPQDLRHQQWQSISIDYDDAKIPGDLLSPLAIFGEEGVFFELLTKLVKDAKSWILVFMPDCDELEEVIAGDLQMAFEKIKQYLSKDRGFILYHGSNSAT